MSAPSVELVVEDFQLGAVSPARRPLVILAPATGATVAADTPTLCFKPSQVAAAFGASGVLTDRACFVLANAGVPVLCVRTGVTTEGTATILTPDEFTGTSVVSIDAAVDPDDQYDVVIRFVTGVATVGNAGATYQISRDGGAHFGPVTALGTALFITVPGGLKVNFTAASIIANDVLRIRTSSPLPNLAQMQSALTAARNSATKFDDVLIPTVITASDITGLNTTLESMAQANKFVRLISTTRTMDPGETMAAYIADVKADYASSSCKRLVLCAGDAFVSSPVTNLEHRREIATAVASFGAAPDKTLSTDIANKTLGPLPGVRIVDEAGNPVCFDEYVHGGLDDFRFTTLRSWASNPGQPYPTNDRLFSPEGSDFRYRTHGHVMDRACETATSALEDILSRPIALNAEGTQSAGFIVEAEALDIEAQVNEALARVLGGHVSSFTFRLSRTDDLLATETLTSSLTIVPLGYPKRISVTAKFRNPVVLAQAA